MDDTMERVIDTLARVLPGLSDMDKGRVVGYGEALAAQTPREAKEPPKDAA